MSKENLIKWVIGVLGVFFIPPVVSFILGILLIIASTEELNIKFGNLKLYGSYCILAGLCSCVLTLFSGRI
jgi:hypothetical protein